MEYPKDRGETKVYFVRGQNFITFGAEYETSQKRKENRLPTSFKPQRGGGKGGRGTFLYQFLFFFYAFFRHYRYFPFCFFAQFSFPGASPSEHANWSRQKKRPSDLYYSTTTITEFPFPSSLVPPPFQPPPRRKIKAKQSSLFFLPQTGGGGILCRVNGVTMRRRFA